MSKLFDTFQRWKVEQTRACPNCHRCVHLISLKSPSEWVGECCITGRLISAARFPRQCNDFYTPNMDD